MNNISISPPAAIAKSALAAHASNRAPAANFDRLARLYRWMELLTFGLWLERCRSTSLAQLANCRRALVLGDGDGRFTARLLGVNPHVEVDAVDSSPAMLRALLRRTRSHAARVRTHCADARGWQPPHQSYDLVVTHFFLDCLSTEEIHSLAHRVRRAVCPAAMWVVSEFAIPESRFGRLVAQPVVWLLYRAFGLLTGLTVRSLPNHRAALGAAGFRLNNRREWLLGLLISETWSRA